MAQSEPGRKQLLRLHYSPQILMFALLKLKTLTGATWTPGCGMKRDNAGLEHAVPWLMASCGHHGCADPNVMKARV